MESPIILEPAPQIPLLERSPKEARGCEGNPLEKAYTLFPSHILGRGAYSTVYLGKRITDASDSKCVAIKVVRKEDLDLRPQRWQDLQTEIAILQEVAEHPHIVRLLNVVEDENRIALVFEHLHTDLFGLLTEQKQALHESERFDPHRAASTVLPVALIRKIIGQLIDAVLTLHRQQICHLDIKMENVLLDEALNVKLADFGFAARLPPRSSSGQLLTCWRGSPYSAAPEVISQKPFDGLKADAWSIGTVLFACAVGYPPFCSSTSDWPEEKDILGVLERTVVGRYRWPQEKSNIPSELKDLVNRLLVVDPVNRLSVEQLATHPFFETQH